MLAISAGIGAAIAGLSYGMFWPRSQLFGTVIYRGGTQGPPHVAITFDDGPDPQATPAILDILSRLGAPAAFFAIGRNVEAFPEIARRIVAEGHLLANHSHSHHRMGMFRRGRYWHQQIRAADTAIEAATRQKPAFMRPPMGFKHWHVTAQAKREGKTLVTWTRRAFDTLPTNSGRIVRRLGERARPGDILTLHDGCEPGRRRDLSATVAAVEPLIRTLRQRGLEPVRLDALLGRPAYLPA